MSETTIEAAEAVESARLISGESALTLDQPGALSGSDASGWIVSTSSAERSSSNDIALLLRDRNSGFAPVRITVT